MRRLRCSMVYMPETFLTNSNPKATNNVNNRKQSPNFLTFKDPKNRFQRIHSASLCSLAGWCDKPIPSRFLASVDCLKIPAQCKLLYNRTVRVRKIKGTNVPGELVHYYKLNCS